jgi:hypothetical protein
MTKAPAKHKAKRHAKRHARKGHKMASAKKPSTAKKSTSDTTKTKS